jgi:hypothetical protein
MPTFRDMVKYTIMDYLEEFFFEPTDAAYESACNMSDNVFEALEIDEKLQDVSIDNISIQSTVKEFVDEAIV